MRHIKPELVKTIDQMIAAKLGADYVKNNLANPKLLMRAALQCLIGVHEEGGNNAGKVVDLFQSTVGSPSRQAWCMDFQQSCIAYVEQKTGLACPLPATEGTQFMADWANKNGLLHSFMQADTLVIWKHTKPGSNGGHVGYVMRASDTLDTIEGNTSPEKGIQSDGDGVFEKHHNPHAVGEMILRGFVPVTFAKAAPVAATEPAKPKLAAASVEDAKVEPSLELSQAVEDAQTEKEGAQNVEKA
jgi:hypothetical protein